MSPYHSPRLVVFGSSFNPIHNGHLGLIQKIATQNWTKKLIVLPCGQHAFQKKLIAGQDRLTMVNLAIAELPPTVQNKITVSDLEINNSQPSYTYLTLQKIQAEHPQEKIVFIIGSENLIDFSEWYAYQQLAIEFDLLVVPRPHFPISTSQLPFPRMKIWQDSIDLVIPDLSSTLIRQKITDGEPITDLVPHSVVNYINDHQLYLKSAP